MAQPLSITPTEEDLLLRNFTYSRAQSSALCWLLMCTNAAMNCLAAFSDDSCMLSSQATLVECWQITESTDLPGLGQGQHMRCTLAGALDDGATNRLYLPGRKHILHTCIYCCNLVTLLVMIMNPVIIARQPRQDPKDSAPRHSQSMESAQASTDLWPRYGVSNLFSFQHTKPRLELSVDLQARLELSLSLQVDRTSNSAEGRFLCAGALLRCRCRR